MEAPPPFWRCALPLGDHRRLLGLVFILAVAVIWVTSSFVVQGIEAAGAHPAVLTFVANSLFAIYFPIYFANLRWRRHRQQQQQAAAAGRDGERSALVPAGAPRSDGGGGPLAGEDSGNGKDGAEPAAIPVRQLVRAALVVAPLWYVAQLTYNASLGYTSVTSNTILSSTSSLFTFLFAVGLLRERFSLWKLGFILLLIAGTTLVTVADGKYAQDPSASHASVLGDLLVLLSAVVYGGYTVAIRKMLGEDEETPMTMFFGFMGLFILAGLGPLLLLLWLVGVPLGAMSWKVFGVMVGKGLLVNVLSDYLWARAILLMGPTIATAGLALQLPLAMALDAVLRSPAWLDHAGSIVMTLLGAGLVVGGFLGVNAAGEDDEKTRHEAWEQRQAALQQELDWQDIEDLSGEGSAALIQPHPDRALGALQRELSGSFEAAAEPRSSGSPGPAGINGVWKGGAADGDGTPPGGSKE